jgi:hypothetical protein
MNRHRFRKDLVFPCRIGSGPLMTVRDEFLSLLQRIHALRSPTPL